MSFLERLQKIRVKKEANYRVDPIAATWANGKDVYIYEPSFTPAVEPIDRPSYRDNLSQQLPSAGKHSASLSFKTIAIGVTKATALALTDAPDWTELLQGCGYDGGQLTDGSGLEFTNQGILFDLLDRSLSSLTIHYWEEDEATAGDSILHVLLGCRGTLEAVLEVGQHKIFTWTFTSIWDIETAGLNNFYVGAQHPTGTGPANSDTQSFDAQAPVTMLTAAAAAPAIIFGGGGWYINNFVIPSLTLTLGNSISYSDDANSVSGYKRVNLTGRNSQLALEPELEKLSASGTSGLDFVKALKQKTIFGMHVRGSRTAGERVYFGFPQAAMREHSRGIREGIETTPWLMDLTDLAAVTGNSAEDAAITATKIALATGTISNNGDYTGCKFKITVGGSDYYSLIYNSTAADDTVEVDIALGSAPATTGGEAYQIDGKEAMILVA